MMMFTKYEEQTSRYVKIELVRPLAFVIFWRPQRGGSARRRTNKTKRSSSSTEELIFSDSNLAYHLSNEYSLSPERIISRNYYSEKHQSQLSPSS